jgi:hypothetical protein
LRFGEQWTQDRAGPLRVSRKLLAAKMNNAPGKALTAAWVANVREKFLAACSEISAEKPEARRRT